MFLDDLHGAGLCHRDIRLDNIVRCSNTYMVIDLELAASADKLVFWSSSALPPDVDARVRGFHFMDDLWQLGKMIRQIEVYHDAITHSIFELAERLVGRHIKTAAEALESLGSL